MAHRFTEIIFEVTEDEGCYVACAMGYGIAARSENVKDLKEKVREAILAHFDSADDRPRIVRLHFVREELLPL
ncbi:MAG: 2-oxoisovalerate dehydrogenase [Chloroflexi bacterium]|nr:2-oxoisovalerate dehydrogenase [Chloroflexota bacterium]